MKIYTRTGDTGKTGLLGERRSKADLRVETIGTVDELNAFVGEALTRVESDDIRQDLQQIARELFSAGSDLALVAAGRNYLLEAESIARLEAMIDRYDEELSPLTQFILPGGTSLATVLHQCRSITRRAERCVVRLSEVEEINRELLRYFNRLSDLFFTLARVANARAGQADIPWKGDE
jgi:cob(I)alamin adenosyltransferase